MIIGYFDIVGIAIDEAETNPPLLVDRYHVTDVKRKSKNKNFTKILS
jgi:hypothetical protein